MSFRASAEDSSDVLVCVLLTWTSARKLDWETATTGLGKNHAPFHLHWCRCLFVKDSRFGCDVKQLPGIPRQLKTWRSWIFVSSSFSAAVKTGELCVGDSAQVHPAQCEARLHLIVIVLQ